MRINKIMQNRRKRTAATTTSDKKHKKNSKHNNNKGESNAQQSTNSTRGQRGNSRNMPCLVMLMLAHAIEEKRRITKGNAIRTNPSKAT